MINLITYLSEINNCIKSNKDLLDFITEFCDFEEKMKISPQMINDIQDSDPPKLIFVNQKKAELNNFVSSIIKHARTKRPDEVIEKSKKAVREFSAIKSAVFSDKDEFVSNLEDFVQKHIDAYSERRQIDAFEILELSNSIQGCLEDIRLQTTFIQKGQDLSQIDCPEGYSNLSIVSDKQILFYSSFIELQQSINELYAFICTLIKKDPKEVPLLVSSVQSGSWLTELLGIDKAIDLIEKIILGFGKFARDIITGKIKSEQIQNECKSIEACMHVYELARKNGIKNAEVGFSPKVVKFIENLYKNSSSLQVNESYAFKLEEQEKNNLLLEQSQEIKKIEHINQLAIGDEEDKTN